MQEVRFLTLRVHTSSVEKHPSPQHHIAGKVPTTTIAGEVHSGEFGADVDSGRMLLYGGGMRSSNCTTADSSSFRLSVAQFVHLIISNKKKKKKKNLFSFTANGTIFLLTVGVKLFLNCFYYYFKMHFVLTQHKMKYG